MELSRNLEISQTGRLRLGFTPYELKIYKIRRFFTEYDKSFMRLELNQKNSELKETLIQVGSSFSFSLKL